ncbi:hypothetical protein C8A05DRAFT_14411, partial [Staphylotrichum tortipilum]
PGSLSPRHRHRLSPEGIFSFADQTPLTAGERSRYVGRFYRIVEHFDGAGWTPSWSSPLDRGRRQYSRPRLVRLTYEYARSETSKDIFLRGFFWSMALPILADNEADLDLEGDQDALGSHLFRFAEYLFSYFFFPLRAVSCMTPQFTPLIRSAIQGAQCGGINEFVGTPERIGGLRGSCLVRDRHRCVVSRLFDQKEAVERLRGDGDGAKDDDGNPLHGRYSSLKVAHILPHSLTKTEKGSLLLPEKIAALDILNMFDHGVVHMIEGDDIDQPRNAVTLDHDLYEFFGSFDIVFEPVPDQEPHTYRIRSLLPPSMRPDLPVVRTLYLTESRTTDPPSPRLLAIHCAIAHILHLSGAGKYISQIMADLEWRDTREDGSTELGRLVALRLGGWLEAISI